MNEELPTRSVEPTLELIRELRDADQLGNELISRILKAKRPVQAAPPNPAEPGFDDIQILTAQLATKPQFEDVAVSTQLVLGSSRPRPLILVTPLLVQPAPLAPTELAKLSIDALAVQTLSRWPGADTELVSSDSNGAQDSMRAWCVPYPLLDQYRDRMRAAAVPVGVALSADNIALDLAQVLNSAADFVVIQADQRAVRALAEARSYLSRVKPAPGFRVILAGGVRIPNDFIKALALGADAVLVSDLILNRILALGSDSGLSAQTLVSNFIHNSTTLMKVMTRACGHTDLRALQISDLTTWQEHVARTAGVASSGHAALAAAVGRSRV